MKVSTKNPPSEQFIAAILLGYEQAKKAHGRVTCADIWDGVVGVCLRVPGGFISMFSWDKSNVKTGVNRIGTIYETVQAGMVPGLCISHDAQGREIVVKA